MESKMADHVAFAKRVRKSFYYGEYSDASLPSLSVTGKESCLCYQLLVIVAEYLFIGLIIDCFSMIIPRCLVMQNASHLWKHNLFLYLLPQN